MAGFLARSDLQIYLTVLPGLGVNLIAVQRVPSLLPSTTGVDSAEAQTIVPHLLPTLHFPQLNPVDETSLFIPELAMRSCS